MTRDARVQELKNSFGIDSSFNHALLRPDVFVSTRQDLDLALRNRQRRGVDFVCARTVESWRIWRVLFVCWRGCLADQTVLPVEFLTTGSSEKTVELA